MSASAFVTAFSAAGKNHARRDSAVTYRIGAEDDSPSSRLPVKKEGGV